MNNPPRSTFSLSGPSISLDVRVHAIRGDLADIALAGQIFAPHYARPMQMQCSAISAMVREAPSRDAKATSQILFGEDFMVVDVSGGWAWGYCRHDHYVGYVEADALTQPVIAETSAIVSVLSASVFERADSGAHAVAVVPMGAQIRGTGDGDFIHTSLGFVHRDAVASHARDAARVAESLIDTPYVWGGRTSTGIDCSGLIQLSLALTGIFAPRDSDQQQQSLGETLPADAALQRGDLIFFPGHVGIMADGNTLVHATQHYGKTVGEPLADVIARVAAEHEVPVLARKRIAP